MSKEPSRWEVCNLAFTATTVVDETDSTFTSVVALAQLENHFGDSQTAQGRALNNAARFMEIGGMVWSYRVNLAQSAQTLQGRSGTWADNRFDHRILVCSDRLSASGGPSSIPNWFIPGTPLVDVSVSTPTQDDSVFPTRIHFQDRLQLSPTNVLVDGAGAPSNLALQTVTNCGRSSNLRLRLRLDDTQGLFFHFATRVADPQAVESTWEWNCDVLGTLYYRVRL